ncbi:Rok-like winged helix domain-containing protein [Bacillus sp. FSL K6-3431]|uniref:Rok-like winged helix domain-containing protein n=1 Tax=Bacillus sp. FSL K6-3431 TaxID=2921500 RepID=UPI0030F66DCC
MALKMRLEQMLDTEERMMRELQKERAFIFNRLRELDSMKENNRNDIPAELHYLESTNAFIEGPTSNVDMEEDINHLKARKNRSSRRSKTTKMRELAIAFLKEQAEPIRSVELKRFIEERTDYKIANMTTFMSTIEKHDVNISKIGRGLYIYKSNQVEKVQNNPIFLGKDHVPENS